MPLTERQKRIFQLVLEGYIASGQPIGSAWVVDQLSDDVSSATVRNELVALEQAGLLRAPHTSAGRVPTEEGYRHYIETFMHPARVDREVKKMAHEISSAETPEERVRTIARELSELAGNVVLVGVDPRSLYAIGMGRMYDAPESDDAAVMRNISYALDRADDLLDNLFEVARSADNSVQILIGKQNPIDENLSLMVTTYASSDGQRIMALLGFMRMRYDRNIALMQAMKRLLEQ